MRKFFGKNGNSAVKTFGKKLDKAFREGKMPGVSVIEKKQIFDRVKKVFTVNGKEANSFEFRKFQKEISNPLRFKSGDKLDAKEVMRFEKALGSEFETRYTKQIGSKYGEVIRAEKRQALKEKKQKVLEAKMAKKNPELKKGSNVKSFHDRLKEDIERRRTALERAAKVNSGEIGDEKSKDENKKDENKNSQNSQKGVGGKAQSSGTSANESRSLKSGGKKRVGTSPINAIKTNNTKFPARQQRADFQYGGQVSEDTKNFIILQNALHKLPKNSDFEYGGINRDLTEKQFDVDKLSEKMPDISERWTDADKLAAMGSPEEIKSDASSASEGAIAPPAPEALNTDIDD